MIIKQKNYTKKNKLNKNIIFCSHIKPSQKQCLQTAKWQLYLTTDNKNPFFSCESHFTTFLKRSSYTVSLIGRTPKADIGMISITESLSSDTVNPGIQEQFIDFCEDCGQEHYQNCDSEIDLEVDSFANKVALMCGDGELEDEYIAQGLEQAALMVDAFLYDYPFISVEICLFDLAEKLRDEASMLKNAKHNADKIYFNNLYVDDQ